ncbi:MAG: transglycosylase domain-containing protein [Calditrichaeota bacterium]|nr:transglycosylase domain-containing protein [Calditrichota bacterium]
MLVIAYCITISDEIPSLVELENTDQSLKTVLYSANNDVIGSIYKENRTNVTYDQLPENLVNALLATEDRAFFDHSGIDLYRMFSAVGKTVIHYLSGGRLFVRQGGGSITMQAARNVYTGRAGTVKRKLLEMMIALELERTYSKKEIIPIYLNTVFYGHHAYGIAAAAKTYYNKDVSELTIDESATLVGLLQSPSNTNPLTSPESAISRRNLVFRFMLESNFINQMQYDTLKLKPIVTNKAEVRQKAPYFVARIEKELKDLGEKLHFDPYTDGLTVFTTMDTAVQNAMDSAIAVQLPEIEKYSFTHPKTLRLLEHYRSDTIYTSTEQADSAFWAKNLIQYGFITLDHRTGQVLGHIGGRDYYQYYFDHVFQGMRLPGSTIKAFLYAAAIESGLSPAHKILDAPYVLFEDDTSRWTPENDNYSYEGLVTLRYGLRWSKNMVALRLQDEIGGPANVRKVMRDMMITAPIKAVPSLPLGTNQIKPIELVSAYGAIANGGVMTTTHTITKILDKNNNLIYEAAIEKKVVMNENTAYILTDMLKSGVNGGTSSRIRFVNKVPYSIEVAGKTGTTDDNIDIWSIAYTPRFTTCIWLGMDDPKHRTNLSSKYAVMVVGEFIRRIYEAKKGEWKPLEFVQPDGVVELEVCGDNDKVQLANVSCPIKLKEKFRKEFAPTENCEIHGFGKKNRKKKDFF